MPGRPLESVPYWHERAGLASCYGRIPGSGCWGHGPTPGRSSGETGPERGRGSASLVLQDSNAYSKSWSWQHLSPFGPAVLHLELELKLHKQRAASYEPACWSRVPSLSLTNFCLVLGRRLTRSSCTIVIVYHQLGSLKVVREQGAQRFPTGRGSG